VRELTQLVGSVQPNVNRITGSGAANAGAAAAQLLQNQPQPTKSESWRSSANPSCHSFEVLVADADLS
jgi:hypothetical protein